MIEKIIFNVLALALFTITFLKLIKKNDTSYIYILALEFIGLAINFIELFFTIKLHWFLKIIIYIFSIIIPVIVLWIEQTKKIDFPELFNSTIAKAYCKFGNQEKAKETITNFLQKNPNSYVAHKLMAEFYEKEKNYEASIAEYMRVTDIRPQDFVSTYKLCEVLNKNKQNTEAIEVLHEIIKQKPEYEKATNLLGEILFDEQMYKEAVSVYMSALKYHPNNYDIYYSLGMAYTMINDFQRAKEFYEKAAQINSLAYNAKLNLGQIALIYGDLEEAEEYFMQSSKHEELEAGSYYYLSQIALLKGDIEKAKNYMNVAIELDPKIYKQVQKDPLFNPIKQQINQPIETNKKQYKLLNQKEKNVNKHLMKTCILVKNLNKKDIQNVKINNKIKFEKNEKQKE